MATPITALNNYLQGRGEDHLLSWEYSSTGPSSQAVWTVKCKFDGDVKGTGTAGQKAAAGQLAAKQAHEVLKKENGS